MLLPADARNAALVKTHLPQSPLSPNYGFIDVKQM